MEIDSVRGLKEEIRRKRICCFLRDEHHRRRLGVRTQAVRAVIPPNSVALGVSRRSIGGADYVLAVRVQHPLLWNSPEVTAICNQARGEVDVRFVGHIRPLQNKYQDPCRPLRIGCSIGQYQITAGTLGAFVQDRQTGTILVLSNNHVLANENQAVAGDPILQPGRFDNGTEERDTVAYLKAFIPLDWTDVNWVDCAAASVARPNSIIAGSLDSRGNLSGGRTAPLAGPETVYKIGRTTALTSGSVTAVEVDNVIVSYDHGTAVFDGQIEVQGQNGTPFAVGGDSGALVFDQDNLALGMVFGGTLLGAETSIGLTYVNPLNTVLNRLNVDLLY
jgi:Trypsin-like peptidase domain